MDPILVEKYAQELFHAEMSRVPITPFSTRQEPFTIDDAYAVQTAFVAGKLSGGGSIIGKKIGLTSKAIQDLLNVREPDYGQLLHSMIVHEQDAIPLSRLIQPKAEGEIAFVLDRDLDREYITPADVLRCTAFVLPAIEIIDSRIEDWKVRITDTVADNASSGLFVLGGKKTPIGNLDLRTLGMALEHNGGIAVTGAGAAALGNPVTCIAWLANTLHVRGEMLRAGDIVLSGALAGTVLPRPGDAVRVSIQKLGSVTARFTA